MMGENKMDKQAKTIIGVYTQVILIIKELTELILQKE